MDKEFYSMVLSARCDIQNTTRLQLLVFYLALQLLRLGHLTNSPVQVVLADGVPVVSNRKQTTVIVRFRQDKCLGIEGRGEHTPL